MFICLCGTVLSGQRLSSLHGTDAYLETSSVTPELETAAIRPPGIDRGVTLLDTHVSSAALPAGKMMFLSFKCCLFLSAQSWLINALLAEILKFEE